MKHALVIGGTGMLSEVSLWLSKNGYHVSVIGRNPEKMQRLLEQNSAQLSPVFVDYTNTKELADHLVQIQQKNGALHLVVAWIHSNGIQVIPCLIDRLPASRPWTLFHVNGSSSNLDEIKSKLILPKHIHYAQILLGFKVENEVSRWLTHQEISGGIIEAIQEKSSKKIIGTISPLEKLP